VVGTKLDNASGAWIDAEYVRNGYQEVVVCLSREDAEAKIHRAQFNLCNLIALARHGAQCIRRGLHIEDY
jgi:hypothetical protein